MVVLRAQRVEDLPLLVGGESPFDDFGPQALHSGPAPCGLEDHGQLSIEDDDGELAGEVSWIWIQWGPNAGSRSPMIGIWLRTGHRGRGIGTAAQAELIDLFFRHTTTNRVQAHTDTANVAEQRALERAGMRAEGTTRGAQWRAGAYHDGVLYALTRDDWTAGRS